MADERIGIRVELDSGAALRGLKELKALKDDLEKKSSARLDLDTGRAQKEVKSILDSIDKLRKELALELRVNGDAADRDMEDVKSRLEQIQQLASQITIRPDVDSRGVQEITSGIENAERAAMSLRDVLSGIGGGFSTFGGIFNSIAGVFDSDLMSMVQKVLTYQTTRLMEAGMKNSASRFDILSTYSDYMSVMGVDQAVAQASLEKVNANIQGLPIGLDEAAYQIRKYNMYLEDADRATNLAIGLDKAMIAGGASESMRNYAKFEIDRLLAVGTLATARQWNALLQGLGVSTKFLKEEMGYASLTTSQFVDELTHGRITTEEFLGGIEALADSDSLEGMLDIYRTTLESGISNLKFAATRGFANLIQGIDDTLRESTGQGISDYMYQIRDEMNAVFKSVDAYIRNNPDMLTDIIDMFKNVYEHAKGVDWAGIATSTLKSFGRFLDMAVSIFEHIPPGALRTFITFGMVWAGPLGRALSNIGAFFNLLSRIPGFGKLPIFRGGGAIAGGASLKSVGLGLLEVAGFIGIIAEVFGTIKLAASAIQDIENLDIGDPDEFMNKALLVGGTLAGIGGMVTGITALGSALTAAGGIGAVAALLGEAITAGFFGNIAIALGDIKLAVSALDDIGKLDVDNLPSNMGSIIGSLSGVFELLDDKSLYTMFKESVGALNLVVVSEAMGKIKTALEAAQGIDNIKIDFTRAGDAVGGMITMLSNVMDDADTVFGGAPEDIISKTGQYSTIFGNLNTAFGNLGGMMDTMKQFRRDLEDPELGMWVDQKYFTRLNPNSPWNDTVVRLRGFFTGMGQIGEDMNDAFNKIKPLRNSQKATSLKTMFADLHTAFKSFGDIADVLTPGGLVKLDRAAEGLTTAIPKIAPILDAISNLGYTKEDKSFAGRHKGNIVDKDISLISEVAKGMQEAMYAINVMISQMSVMGDNLDTVQGEHIGEKIQSVMQSIRSIFKFEIPKDASDIQERSEALQGAVEAVAGIIETLKDKQEMIESVEGDGTATTMGGIISQLVGSFSTEEFAAIQEQMGQITEWLDSLATSSSTLAAVDFGPFIESIEDVSKKVDEVKAKVELLSDAFVTLADSADHAKSAIDRVADTAVARQGDFAGIEGAIRRVREVLSGAAAQADALTQAINNIPKYTDIVVNVHMGGAVGAVGTGISAGINAIRSRYQADGGMIYAASGFQKRGTDVVPAMLTPGEFVVRKAAVDTFGSRLMRQINSLNIEGAMREMFSYTGLPIGVNSVVDNSRSYDSHNSVTQNVYSNNPNYSKKRAYKGLCMA